MIDKFLESTIFIRMMKGPKIIIVVISVNLKGLDLINKLQSTISDEDFSKIIEFWCSY